MAEKKAVARRRSYQRTSKFTPDELSEFRQIKFLALGEVGGDFNKLPAAARKYGIPVARLRKSFFAAAGRAKGLAYRQAAMATNDWKDEMDARAIGAVQRGLEDKESYNEGRIGLGWLKGNGILKEDPAQIGTQNNLTVIVRNEEEGRRFFELGRDAAGLPARTNDGETALVTRADSEPDQEGSPVVAAEGNQDVRPAMGVEGQKRALPAVSGA